MNKDFDQNIVAAKDTMSNFNTGYNQLLEQLNIKDSNRPQQTIQTSLLAIFEDNDKGAQKGALVHVAACIGTMRLYERTLTELIINEEKELKWTINRTNEENKAKRRQMWWLWTQQTCRWIMGAALAIFVYSCAVWISEWTGQPDCPAEQECDLPDWQIKIPIKDWIPANKS